MTDNIKRITVLGAGRWGTAMAIYLSRKNLDVTVQCHLKEEYQQLVDTGIAPNLPGYNCEGRIKFEMDLENSIVGAQLIIMAMPVAFLRSVLGRMGTISKDTVILSINKGIERETLQTVPTIIKEYFPNHVLAHLGGPCFPDGLLSKTTPVAETLACEDEKIGAQLQQLISSADFRVYGSRDVQGVATLGALKNVYAIIAGVADGFGMYEEVISVIVTRGLAEMKRYCQKMGFSLETLYGLSGLGDLALTCYSPANSHNKNFGIRLGKGEKTQQILDSMDGTIAEGYFTTKAVWDIANNMKIELPLCKMAYEVIYKGLSIEEGLQKLMRRPLKLED
ncbi:MAG: NAD(P)H-dependent glycerol-3-phosphate dehydrogenase [Deltaproteobacteria bacterium]|jgi:glycerol-3-phosphate dehydrogenase (NAD(P)+)|nr:NAD(P)H-dependent glycerol-3-phosphate dehydrogenase [Deltaproteobacteria bacterium]MBT4525170.1 NAD(P)H-dependent glycerol-3-phosphate dehydrogenase [Deltaproteobacteria bacterium]